MCGTRDSNEVAMPHTPPQLPLPAMLAVERTESISDLLQRLLNVRYQKDDTSQLIYFFVSLVI